LILKPCFDIKKPPPKRKKPVNGIGGGFKQGKPTKALLELKGYLSVK
jgi:hypothetical protein